MIKLFKSPIPKDVKEEILNKVKGGESVTVVATSYGISNRTIYGWLGRKALNSVSMVQYNRLKKENAQLKEIVGILTFELEKLKKKIHP